MFFARNHAADRKKTVGFIGGNPPGCIALDCIEFTKETPILVEDYNGPVQIIIGHGAVRDLFDAPFHAVVFMAQVGHAVFGVRILRQVQNLAGVVEIPPPDGSQIASGIADWM